MCRAAYIAPPSRDPAFLHCACRLLDLAVYMSRSWNGARLKVATIIVLMDACWHPGSNTQHLVRTTQDTIICRWRSTSNIRYSDTLHKIEYTIFWRTRQFNRGRFLRFQDTENVSGQISNSQVADLLGIKNCNAHGAKCVRYPYLQCSCLWPWHESCL